MSSPRRAGRPLRAVLAAVCLVGGTVVFLVPFVFMVLVAGMDASQSAFLRLEWPEPAMWAQNLMTVLQQSDYLILRGFVGSLAFTVCTVVLLVVVCSFVGYVMSRRRSGASKAANALVLFGLIVPPAIIPTIFIMKGLGIFNTFPGLVLIEAALFIPFTVLLFRGFVAGIPRELDEAAIIDGAGPIRLFWTVILPLLRPVIVTVIIITSIGVFNEFVTPLYFLPGSGYPTIQLVLYSYQGQYLVTWNLLFTGVLLVTIPMAIMYVLFNRQIVGGLAAGAVKG